jgi:hypothetical protein
VALTLRKKFVLNRDMLTSLVHENQVLQRLLKEDDDFQDLVCGFYYLNRTGRLYFQEDPLNKVKGIYVLRSTTEIADALFLHLRENPALCVRPKEKPSRKRKARDSDSSPDSNGDSSSQSDSDKSTATEDRKPAAMK